MALLCGADAVFELPALFAVRDAERFARGGVSLLSSLGAVTHLGFGSETGELAPLMDAAFAAPDTDAVRSGLAGGQTLARARGAAQGFAADMPNDTLGIEYLRALAVYGEGIEPVTIRREGSGHHDAGLSGMASATAIRAAIRRGEDVSAAMPGPAFARLSALLAAGAYQQADGLDTALLAKLRAMSAEELAETADVSEGLENRILRAAQIATSREALLSLVKCKRYTRARLSRVLTQTFLGITKVLTEGEPLPSYARLLGFRSEARPLMAAISERARIPIVTRAAPFRRQNNAAFTVDLRAGDLWALGLQNQAARGGGRELTEKMIIIKPQEGNHAGRE